MAPPAKVIDHEKVTSMRKADASWIDIAKELKVSRATLKFWKGRVNFVDPLVELDGEELDKFVLASAGENVGEVRMMQLLVANGFRARRHVLRESIGRVDREGRNKRKCVWLLYGTDEDGAENNTDCTALPVKTVPALVAPPPSFCVPVLPSDSSMSPSIPLPAPACDERHSIPSTTNASSSVGKAGRKATYVDLAKVTTMRRANIGWNNIAKELCLSRKTLGTWKAKVKFEEPLVLLSGDELDHFVLANAGENVGEVRMMQLLITGGFKARRHFLRESMGRVDGDGRSKRKRVHLLYGADE